MACKNKALKKMVSGKGGMLRDMMPKVPGAIGKMKKPQWNLLPSTKDTPKSKMTPLPLTPKTPKPKMQLLRDMVKKGPRK